MNFIKELKKLISENTAINIIATQNFTDEELIPIKSREAFSKIIDLFDPLYIHLLKSKQIKGLINNWVNISDLDVHQNIEKLIPIMKELHLRIDAVASLKDEGCDSKKQVIKLADDYLDWLGIEE